MAMDMDGDRLGVGGLEMQNGKGDLSESLSFIPLHPHFLSHASCLRIFVQLKLYWI